MADSGETRPNRLDTVDPPYCYTGWVPCILTELAFELSSVDLGEWDVFHLNVAAPREWNGGAASECGRAERRILATSVVDWRDRPDAEPDRRAGLFRVLLFGEVVNPGGSRHLSGHAYIIQQASIEADGKADPSERALLKRIHVLQAYHDDIDWSGQPRKRRLLWGALDQSRTIASAIHRYVRAMSGHRRAHFEVAVSAYGVLDLQLAHSSFRHNPGSHDVLARQMGHFVKYLLHRHTHHALRSESLTTVHRTDGDRVAALTEVLREIEHGYAWLKRSPQADFHEARGYLAYAQSLSDKLEVLGQRPGGAAVTPNQPALGPADPRERAQREHATTSIETLQRQRERREHGEQRWRGRILNYLTLSLLLLGPLLFAALSLRAPAGLNAQPDVLPRTLDSMACADGSGLLCSVERHLQGGIVPLLLVYTVAALLAFFVCAGLLLRRSRDLPRRNWLTDTLVGRAKERAGPGTLMVRALRLLGMAPLGRPAILAQPVVVGRWPND